MYGLSLDAGPDNLGCVKKMISDTSTMTLLMIFAFFCVLHGIHHIFERLIKLLNAFDWSLSEDLLEADPEAVPYATWPCSFEGGVKTVCNSLRFSGNELPHFSLGDIRLLVRALANRILGRCYHMPFRGRSTSR